MKLKIVLPVLLTLLSLLHPLHGVETTTLDDLWYYEIGGAQPVSAPPNPKITTLTLPGSADLNLGFSCGRFDPEFSVTEAIDRFAGDADLMIRHMVQSAFQLLFSLPALILQRANPELYNLFQTYLADAQARLAIATKTCEQLESDIGQGKNPFEEWIRLAKTQKWRSKMEDGGDIILAKQEIETAGGDEGLPWIFGMRGGLGQEPIQVIRDTTAAGYNVTLNRAPNTSTTSPGAGGTETPRIVELWNTPDEAAGWAVDVLGDDIVMTCYSCTKTSTPGAGLLPQYEQERIEMVAGLADLVSGVTDPGFENLDALSAPGTGITRHLLEAVQALPANEQSIVSGRLASEIAQARTVERALLIRRLLLTGRRVPEVSAYAVATQSVDAAVAELEQEIENLLFETRLRREVVSTTAKILLERDVARQRRSLTKPGNAPFDTHPVEVGRVPQ